MGVQSFIYAGIAGGIVAIIAALYFAMKVSKFGIDNERVSEITAAIREGAMAFLSAEYKILAAVVVVVAVILGIFVRPMTALTFVIGAFTSALAGNIGMRIATKANGRTAIAAQKSGMSKALDVSFAGGAVMGMAVVGLGILGITILYLVFGDIHIVEGFGMGASCIALFARVGGGIYTKAADVGADLVGKVEAGIPEDDPRNPATIADNVGDNVGDVAGMGADLFESYVVSLIAAMALGVTIGEQFMILPLMLAVVGIFSSIIATFTVKTNDPKKIHSKINNATTIAGILSIIGSYGVIVLMKMELKNLWAIAAGLIAGIVVALVTGYYTEKHKKPVNDIVSAASTGPATVIIKGLGVGMQSTLFPVLIISASLLVAYGFAGAYGIALSALGMLATTGIVVAIDAYGPIADNAGGIAEMSELPSEVRAITDELDAVGNSTAAVGKGFAVGSAAATVLALLATFKAAVVYFAEKDGVVSKINNFDAVNRTFAIDLTKTEVIVGLLIGGMVAFLFAALTMNAVGKAAMQMVEEVRRQFREIAGIMEKKAKPDYKRCVEISTTSALKEMVMPGVIAIAAPILVGMWSIEALGGLLAGALVAGVLLGITMSNAGGAWDNSKKQIEGEDKNPAANTGKGSDRHKAAVVGDTVGDPFKDTSGPALNILIKMMSVISLVLVPLFVKFMH